MFIDVHCHLDMLPNIDEVLAKARKKGVKTIVTQGVDIETNRKALDLAEEYPEVKAALGIYPIDALKLQQKQIDMELQFMNRKIDRIAAIGEVGLDLKDDTENLGKQQKVLQKFIDFAKEHDKPIIIHSRKAEKYCIAQLRRSKVKKVIMHCFSGKLNLVDEIIQNGWYLSIPTSVKNSEHFQNVIKMTPIEQLLCETDSPYLHPDREFPNTPDNVVESYKKIAEIKGISVNEVEKQIERNYHKLFS